jgi:hypothetical protein
MYPKVKTVRRGGRSYEYLELVEGRREGNRVRQHVAANLGRLDELTADGKLEQLAAGLARLHQPPAGTRRWVGPLLIVAHYLRELGVAQIVDAAIPRRGRALAGHGEIAAVLAASRLCSPAPLYDIAGRASSAAIAELLGTPAALLNDDRLGRSLEALAKVAEDIRGQLMLATAGRFPVADASRLHLDLTAVRFAGHYPGSGLVERGWAADRRIARQVKTLQASVPAGVTLYFRPHKGASSERPAFAAALEALAAALPPGLVVVAGSGLGYLDHLCAADAGSVRFVVPLRADTGWAARFDADVPGGPDALTALDHVCGRERRLPEDQRTVWRGLLAPFPVDDPATGHHDLRAAYIWSSQQAATVREARERALARAEDGLAKIRNGLGGRYYKTRKQVGAKAAQILTGQAAGLIQVRTATKAGKPVISWHRDQDAVTAASRLDGLYALATNLPDHDDGTALTALDVLKTYKDQWVAERRRRDLKQTLRVRPVFLHNDDRIEALIAIIGIALLIFGLTGAELRASLGKDAPLPGILPEGRAAIPTTRAVLAAFGGLHLTYTPGGIVLDPLTPVQRTILAHLNIPLPWPEKPI